jgi:ribonuclease HII
MRRQSLEQLERAVAGGPPYAAGLLEALSHDSRAGARRILERCRRRLEALAAEEARREACLAFERTAQSAGHCRVAGVDEAGRGPLAGPIVAAAVVLDGDPPPGLNDSKQLKAEQREILYDQLRGGAHAIGVAIVEAHDIDAWGIQQANMTAMRRAAEALTPAADYLLVDGFSLPASPCPHERIIKGDARSLSIAAASIIAKVTRDRIMQELETRYPGYGFAKHKGYGTRDHLEAIARLGPSPVHRTSFAPIAQAAGPSPLFADTERTPPACASS